MIRVKRGAIVLTRGPWSNGHEEQVAVITNVRGGGFSGDLVNLHLFIDLSDVAMVYEDVPWFATYAEAQARMLATPGIIGDGGPMVCWSDEP